MRTKLKTNETFVPVEWRFCFFSGAPGHTVIPNSFPPGLHPSEAIPGRGALGSRRSLGLGSLAIPGRRGARQSPQQISSRSSSVGSNPGPRGPWIAIPGRGAPGIVHARNNGGDFDRIISGASGDAVGPGRKREATPLAFNLAAMIRIVPSP